MIVWMSLYTEKDMMIRSKEVGAWHKKWTTNYNGPGKIISALDILTKLREDLNRARRDGDASVAQIKKELDGQWAQWLAKRQHTVLKADAALKDSLADIATNVVRLYQNHIASESRKRRKAGAKGPPHLDANKVRLTYALSTKDKTTFNIKIDIPGIQRAYRNILIRPKKSKYLAIPMKPSYGAARNFAQDLFFYKTKAGNKALAYVSSGKLVVTHILKNSVFQPRDPSLLPSRLTIENYLTKATHQAVFKYWYDFVSTILYAKDSKGNNVSLPTDVVKDVLGILGYNSSVGYTEIGKR